MSETKRFTIRLSDFYLNLIEKYKKNRTKSTFIKEAIKEKAENES
jgi:hypothetical protein